MNSEDVDWFWPVDVTPWVSLTLFVPMVITFFFAGLRVLRVLDLYALLAHLPRDWQSLKTGMHRISHGARGPSRIIAACLHGHFLS